MHSLGRVIFLDSYLSFSAHVPDQHMGRNCITSLNNCATRNAASKDLGAAFRCPGKLFEGIANWQKTDGRRAGKKPTYNLQLRQEQAPLNTPPLSFRPFEILFYSVLFWSVWGLVRACVANAQILNFAIFHRTIFGLCPCFLAFGGQMR